MNRMLTWGVLALAVSASPVNAAVMGQWYDRYAGKRCTLTARDDEIIIRFRAHTSAGTRQATMALERLTEAHPQLRDLGLGVYRVPDGQTAASVASRIMQNAAVTAATPAVTDEEGHTRYYVPGQFTIQLDQSLSDGACREMIRAAGSRVTFDYWTPGFYRITIPQGKDLGQAIDGWYENPRLVFAEPAYFAYDSGGAFVPNDDDFGVSWHFNNTKQGSVGTNEADIQAIPAWDITKGSSDVLIAIVDTGMELSHPDLAGNLLTRGTEDWDFACNCDSLNEDCGAPCTPDGSPDDADGHGTYVAGAVSALQNNTIGVSGTAPLCPVMPLRISLTGGLFANRADAINFAASKKSAYKGLIINCSWHTGLVDYNGIKNAITDAAAAGCVICFSSGNKNSLGDPVQYPAKYSALTGHPVIAVGATNQCDARTSYEHHGCANESFGSDYGSELDVVAPGNAIWTTQLSSLGASYAVGSGTTMSAPIASGVCALIISAGLNVDSAHPLSRSAVRQILLDSCEDLVGYPGEDGVGRDDYMGYGRVNAYRAVQLASKYPLIDVTRSELKGYVAQESAQPGKSVAWGDYDGDGKLDLYIANHPGANRVLHNDGADKFTRITSTPLEDTGYGSAAAWADYDNDGDLDLYLVNNGSANKLFRNDGGGAFTDVTSSPLGDAGNGAAFAWLDYNNDGWIDIYLVNGGNGGSKLFKNNGGCSWSDVTPSGGLADNGAGVATGDYDNDGDVDVYLVKNGSANKLFRNDGGGVFTDVTSSSGLGANGQGQSAAWGDYDNDGDRDLFLVDQNGNKLFRNNGNGTFTDVTASPLSGIYNGRGVAWGDYDNDGFLDLYLSNDSNNKLLHNNGDGSFTDVTVGPLVGPGAGRGCAWGDYDNDGDLDLYVVDEGYSNKLFRNHAAGTNHWFKLVLKGTDSNRSAIGAQVRVVTWSGTVKQIREVGDAGGFRSQNALTAHFGLGSTATIDTLRIRWPSGTVQVQASVSADQEMVIEECPSTTADPTSGSMSGWGVYNPDPDHIDLHFSFNTTHRASQFEVRYRVHGTSPWTTIQCSGASSSCLFNCDGTYEAIAVDVPCEDGIKFDWQARALIKGDANCQAWSSWLPSTPNTITPYCLDQE